jgi:dephospho-CoA kinase
MSTKVQNKIFTFGLTGGIGSGKTEVGKIFESFGAKLICADLVAREIIDTDPAIKQKIIKSFGNAIYSPDGKLNRREMAELIFRSSDNQKMLNKIVHPYVINYIDAESDRYKQTGEYPLIVVEAALIYEAHAESSFDYIIVVEADDKSRIKWLMARDHLQRNEILKRFASQIPQSEKTKQADFIIQNSGDLKALHDKCSFIFRLLCQMSNMNSIQKEM